MPLGRHEKVLLGETKNYLEFTGQKLYTHFGHEGDEYLKKLVLTDSGQWKYGLCLSVDLEWTVSYIKGAKQAPTALIQIGTSNTVILYHVAHMTGIPPFLKTVLESFAIFKVGLNIKGDVRKLFQDFNVCTMSFIELDDLAKALGVHRGTMWSLDSLLYETVRLSIKKEGDVRCGNWNEYNLSEDQIKYAILDIHAGMVIFNKLCQLADSEIKWKQCIKDFGKLEGEGCLDERIQIGRQKALYYQTLKIMAHKFTKLDLCLEDMQNQNISDTTDTIDTNATTTTTINTNATTDTTATANTTGTANTTATANTNTTTTATTTTTTTTTTTAAAAATVF